MNVLLYIPSATGKGRRLGRMIEELQRGTHLETYERLEGFCQRLRQPVCDIAVMVLYAFRKRDLEEILTLQELLGDARIILILPDHGRETVAKGHSLRPRFLAFADNDPQEVVNVLGKMLSRKGRETFATGGSG